MPEKRTTRRRPRRGAALKPHERALLAGAFVPGQNIFARMALSTKAPTPAVLEQRLALVERHADLIPDKRRPVIERYVAAWRGELRPGEICDGSRWWIEQEAKPR